MENREIKFRAWDGSQMYQIKSINNISHDGEIDVATALKRGIPVTLRTTHGHIFMQFTGLKDKNGKDIYEGDIVKHPKWRSKYKCSKCGNSPKEEQLFRVFWQSEWHHDYGYTTVGRWAKEVIGGFDEYEFTNSEQYEIIGNIYENEELL